MRLLALSDQRRVWGALVALGLCSAAVACGSTSSDAGEEQGSGGSPATGGSEGTGGSREPFKTGVDGSKPLQDLTDEESAKVCEATLQVVDDVISSPCAILGVLAAVAQDDEVLAKEACLAARVECEASRGEVEEACDVPKCAATVAEYETCFDELGKSFGSLGALVPSCETLSPAALLPLLLIVGTAETPESCTALEERCPGAGAGLGGVGLDEGLGFGGE